MKVTELNVMDTNENLGLYHWGKHIGEGSTSVKTCDGINVDVIVLEQDGDDNADVIILFGREMVEQLRDTLTLHLARIDAVRSN